MPQNPKVLIIEDDPDQIVMYRVAFESQGFMVIVTNRGIEAMDLAIAEKPDAILVDIFMEDKSGLDVVRELKQEEKTKHIPIVVFTNFSKEKFEDEAMRSGASKFITKTSRMPREIVDDVRELVDR